MGKAYDHNYLFAGGGSSFGTMVCCQCNQPIFQHAHDWMVYKKSKNHDWGFYCFHRKCVEDQSGWVRLEKAADKHKERAANIQADLSNICRKYKCSPSELVPFLEDDHD